MLSRPASPGSSPYRRDGLAVAVVAFGLYAVLARSGFYAADAEGFVYWVAKGGTQHPHHFAYLMIVGTLYDLLRPLGWDAFESLRFASVLFTAFGVLVLHRAAVVLGCGRRDAVVVAGLCGVLPGVVFFAAVIEVHGVFFPFAAFAWLAAARDVGRRSVASAALLGVATGLAASLHATGHLLPLLVVAWSLALPGGGRRWFRFAATAVVHAAVAAALGAAFGSASGFGTQWAFFASFASGTSGADLAAALWNEWLVAYAPVSVGFLIALAGRSTRRPALALAGVVVPYVAVAGVLVDALGEHGAYLLPLAFPAVVLTVTAAGRRAALACAAIALACSIHALESPASRIVEPDREIVELAEYAAEHGCFVICGDAREIKSLARFAPELEATGVAAFVAAVSGVGYEVLCAHFDHVAAALAERGRAILITDAALDVLRAAELDTLRRFAVEHLPARYDEQQVAGRSFRGVVLRRR